MSFYTIQVKNPKQNVFEIAPDFQVEDSDSDLMIRGKSFYAVWDEERGLWNRNERRVKTIVDKELRKKAAEVQTQHPDAIVTPKYMLSYSSGSWDKWKSYVSKLPDQFIALDDKLSFADTELKREDYASKRLPYALKPGSHESYDELMDTLYSKENRDKIEWAIGSILSGDSKEIQKFLVLYGKGGKGKGTVLKIIHKLFEGYDTVFSAQNLSLRGKDFAMEPFSTNPLVAIDEDGDLSRIEDATRINSIVSHERVLMNEKGKPQYPYIPHCILFMASNEPVKIKNAESGIIRRLIDVEPTGKTLDSYRYDVLMERIGFELGGIAEYCYRRYKELGGKHAYNHYKPKGMMYRTDIFLNFIEDKYDVFLESEGVSLSDAYPMWTDYCQRAGIDPKSYQRPRFRDELKNYFREFHELTRVDGKLVRSYYSGFIKECLNLTQSEPVKAPESNSQGLLLLETESPLDKLLCDCRAQYAASDGSEKPMMSWDKVTTTLKDLNTKLLHYLLGPEWLIMIDFDLKNEEGKKDKKLNLEAAAKWPPTYAEFSKGGAGIHLYYRYTGDTDVLKGLYAPDIEVKIYRGKASIRRRLSYCNNLEIATISSGLPAKEPTMVSEQVIKDERYLTNVIRKAIRREVPGCEHTKPAVDFIKKVLDDAYASGMNYDVERLYSAVMAFAMQSHNNKRYCTDLLRKMHFKSKEASDPVENKYAGKLAFFDLEVAPNVNCLCWKVAGEENPVRKVLLPKPSDIDELLQYDIIGFNNRKFDNHILHALRLGYKPYDVFKISKAIIVDKNDSGYFREAWDYSKTDILDFSSEKKSLKKFEIDMDSHHQEMNVDWTKDIPEERWSELLDYCANDVIATEKLFFTKERQADWIAREILADIAEMSTNSTTNSLSTKIIFQGDKHPQSQFNYRFMGDVSQIDPNFPIPMIDEIGLDPEYTKFDKLGRPIFPGYTYDWSKNPDGTNGPKISKYRGEEVGEGGYVYAEQGIFTDVPVLDVESMHPSSAEDEVLFGEVYTKRFSDLKRIRVLIKHKNYNEAKKLFGGKLAKYLNDESQAEALSQALKIVINSVYGLTSAKFDNPFRDPRNEDNIVAKRGALFMVNLKHEVQRRGFTVAHIKTDSIKIPNATPEIIRFVFEYGKLYGYKFDHESTYDRMCLVNDAVYIAKGASIEKCQSLYGYIPSKQKKYAGKWTATGKQFQVPYVFKKLFSHEELDIHDMMETMSVTTGLYLDMNENMSKGDHKYVFVGKCGAFCPILPGHGGGELMRQNGEKYDAASGTKGYRWKEFEVVRTLGLEDDIDTGYYERQCEKAIAEINKYGNFNLFVSDLPYDMKGAA